MFENNELKKIKPMACESKRHLMVFIINNINQNKMTHLLFV